MPLALGVSSVTEPFTSIAFVWTSSTTVWVPGVTTFALSLPAKPAVRVVPARMFQL